MPDEKPDYYSRVNENLLAMIPPSAETILEVGCGAGALARAYKRRNPECLYHGIEANRDAAIEIGPEISRVYRMRLEDGSESFFDMRFDCLVFGDVLEHLEDPWGQLKKCVGWLKPGGQCLASIPNVGYYGAIIQLLNQDWTYMEEGILDRTHLRWFTRNTIEEMVKQAGLTVFEMVPCVALPEHFDNFMKAVEAGKSLWGSFGVDIGKLKQEALVYQWLVRSVKAESPGKKLLIRPFPGPGCCVRPRLAEPGQFLNTVPGVKYAEAMTDISEWESVVVIRQRTNWFLDQIRSMVAKGCLIVGEWDDDPKVFVDGFEHQIEPIDLMIRGCHAIQTTTERMAETIRAWNPEVAVFPNQIAELPPPREYTDEGPVRIFFGCQNRKTDWLPIMPSLNRVLEEYGDRVFVEVVHDREFYDALTVGKDRKAFRPFLPYDEYRKVLRTCDIALLPLARNEFNEHKSDIKFIECAAEGVAVWAQHTVYFETIYSQQDGDGGYDPMGKISESTEGFGMDLRDLIGHPEYRRMLAKRAYEYVRDHRMLKGHYEERLAWYQSLAERKDELDEALLERAPELFEDSE